MSDRNSDILEALSDEVDELVRRNGFTRADYERILAEALKVAVTGDDLEFVYMAANPEWRQDKPLPPVVGQVTDGEVVPTAAASA